MSLISTLCFALICTFFFSGDGMAAMEITPMVGYRFGGGFDTESGGSLDLREGGSGALAVDFDFESNSQIELFWSHQESALADHLSGQLFGLDIDYIHIGGTTLFPQNEFPLVPYIGGGLGVTHFNPESGGGASETRFSLSLGGGVRYFPTKHIGLRAEGRGYMTWFPDNSAMFCTNSSCKAYVSGDTLLQFEGLAGIIVRF